MSDSADPAQRRCLAIVLAAGEGQRMRSKLAKPLHAIAGRSMLGHVIAAAASSGAADIAIVIGPGREDVGAEARRLAPQAQVFVQAERLGTGHAVLAARAAIARGYDDILIVYADLPLLSPASLAELRTGLTEASLMIAGFIPGSPLGYGRLIERGGELVAVREEKDASAAERAITLCNAGPMALRGDVALTLLDAIRADNAQKEYYLTDIAALAHRRGFKIRSTLIEESEAMGVNDRVQLAAAEAQMQQRLRRKIMLGGASLADPASVFLSFDAKIGQDVTIGPNVVIGKGVEIADGATIHAFSHLEGASIASGASIGPYARLRPGANIGPGAKIGNFVEIKSADIEAGAKVSHLSYIGDARIGAGANVGAGTITCNYDGFSKFKTEIGAGAFIGSNSALVAPVAVGAGAYVGSGSVVTQNVEADALALGRARQINKPGWAKTFRAKQKLKAKP